MTYSVHVQQIGQAGIPRGRVCVYETESETEAVVIAAYEVDTPSFGAPRLASVFDPAGVLLLVYAGRAPVRLIVGHGR